LADRGFAGRSAAIGEQIAASSGLAGLVAVVLELAGSPVAQN
jgi:hypothetical protein